MKAENLPSEQQESLTPQSLIVQGMESVQSLK